MVVIGMGCRRGVTVEALLAAVRAAAMQMPQGLRADRIATAGFKRDEPALAALAQRLGLPLIAVGDAALAAASGGITTASGPAIARRGVPSVAEAAALSAAGPGARLIVPRLVLGPVTCAIAKGACPA